jgi:NAD(P)-dependent dehydrogenase (short-subunit alcohol dehydrogenase family)
MPGGASGFGAAISKRFAQEGAKVLIADLNESGAATMAEKVGSGSISLKMDVTQDSDWKKALDTVVEKFGRIDIMVNNAGTSYRNKVSRFTEERATNGRNMLSEW